MQPDGLCNRSLKTAYAAAQIGPCSQEDGLCYRTINNAVVHSVAYAARHDSLNADLQTAYAAALKV